MADVVLGIETSCDETSAALLVATGGRPPELASLVILSQDVHQVFGGVVPELASRAHLQALPAVVDRALAEAGLAWSAVDGVAVTAGPGLVGALLVGVVYAKGLAYAGGRALIVGGLSQAIQKKTVTYDLARLMDGATELRTSQFADAIIANM